MTYKGNEPTCLQTCDAIYGQALNILVFKIMKVLHANVFVGGVRQVWLDQDMRGSLEELLSRGGKLKTRKWGGNKVTVVLRAVLSPSNEEILFDINKLVPEGNLTKINFVIYRLDYICRVKFFDGSSSSLTWHTPSWKLGSSVAF